MESINAVDLRKMKRLDRRRHEELERLLATIKLKEEELSSIRARSDPEQTQVKVKALRAKKEEVIAQRRKIDQQLQLLNKEVGNKRDTVTKIQSNLKYKKEDKIDEAIRRLEYQLQVNNFKVNEEKKIVQEIDSLKRSKRSLKEFNVQKDELDKMRKSQNSMRSERDALYKKVTEIKAQEEKIKKEVAEDNANSDILKQEIDQLYGKKRAVIAEFQQAQQLREEQRRQIMKKKQEEKLTLQEGKHKDGECSIVVMEPYLEERQLCATLLAYLQKFDRVYPMTCSTERPVSLEVVDSPGHLSEGHTPSTPQFEQDGILLRKKADDLFEYPSKSRNRKLRKEKKKKQEKPVSHSLEIFEQFDKLNLQAPSTQLEIPATIEQLKTKKKYYERLASQSEDLALDFLSNASSSSVITTSVAMSACSGDYAESQNCIDVTNADSTSYVCPSRTFEESSSSVSSSTLLMPSPSKGSDVDNGNSSVLSESISEASSVFCISLAEAECTNYSTNQDAFVLNSSVKDCVENSVKLNTENSLTDVESQKFFKTGCRQRPMNLEFVPKVNDSIHSFQNSPSCKPLGSFSSSDEFVNDSCPFVNGH